VANGSAAVLRHVQTIFRTGSSGSLTDGQLLDRYRSGHADTAEAAFEALVERHAGMVFALCRAVLGDPHDAEDALQATFLVLARQVRSIREPGSVAGWLARVARRVAIRAKARSAVRRAREREAAEREARRTMSGPPESYVELYEEIDRLPARFPRPGRALRRGGTDL
jgi:RNA polymerase sigma factor (sigma-70 family)